MALAEMYDYLSSATPDYEGTLNIDPQGILDEDGEKFIEQHEGDDNSEESIILSSDSTFYVTLIWKALTQTNAGTIFNLYHDSAKACGTAKSFWWTPPAAYDGHTYVVKFRGGLKRRYFPNLKCAYPSIILRIIGRKPD